MFDNKVPSQLTSELGKTFQGIQLESMLTNGCHYNNSTDFAMNRVGDYIGQNRCIVSVGGELIELHPRHHTSCTITLVSLCCVIVRAVGSKTTLEHTKRLRASCVRVPNPPWLAKASSWFVSIDIMSLTESGVLAPA